MIAESKVPRFSPSYNSQKSKRNLSKEEVGKDGLTAGVANSNAARKAFVANRVGDLAMILAMILIYGAMFATGYWIYADYTYAIVLTIVALIAGFLLTRMWGKIKATIFE